MGVAGPWPNLSPTLPCRQLTAVVSQESQRYPQANSSHPILWPGSYTVLEAVSACVVCHDQYVREALVRMAPGRKWQQGSARG